MAILNVGGDLNYKTIGAALAAALEGDTVIVGGGTYYEAIVLATPGVSVIAKDGAAVTIDGRYSPALFGDGNYAMSNGRKVGAGQLPSLAADNARRGGWVYSGGNLNINGYSSLVRLVGNGTSISGVTLRNSAGRFIVVEGNDCTIEDCRMDFCYGGAISIATGSEWATLRKLTVTRSSVKKFDTGAPGAGPDAVATTVICGGSDVLIEGCTICYNYGEGISADKNSVRPIVRGNVCHTNYHWSLGFNYTDGAVIEGNVVYWCDNLIDALGKGWPADGFVGGSERASPENPKEARSPNISIANNLFVGYLKRPWLLGSTGRPVQFVDSRIAENTIVGRVTPGKPGATFTWTALKTALHEGTTVS
ncbi:right-handed parallel beta-helix repeat-containing protein, partial [Thauera sp.]|uniref:right-handed parallel beta-helix repeat-containing protein n=1 Tax=Thauera sp. TaxID=1905334 RepID=UPI002BFD8B8C